MLSTQNNGADQSAHLNPSAGVSHRALFFGPVDTSKHSLSISFVFSCQRTQATTADRSALFFVPVDTSKHSLSISFVFSCRRTQATTAARSALFFRAGGHKQTQLLDQLCFSCRWTQANTAYRSALFVSCRRVRAGIAVPSCRDRFGICGSNGPANNFNRKQSPHNPT